MSVPKHHRVTQLAVYQLLAHTFESVMSGYMPKGWSVQGMGMLRLYISDIGRLHIWDSRLRYPGVSMIHNHSWDMSSTVISGEIANTRYEYVEGYGKAYYRKRIQCGPEYQEVEAPVLVSLRCGASEIYLAGQDYNQVANEIHRTDAFDGTITLMERQHDGPLGQADVFWPEAELWGNAKPRPATMAEIAAVVKDALMKLTEEIRG